MAGIPTTYTYPNGLLIANYLTGTADGTPTATQVNGVGVASVLELQSTSGSLLISRMTTAQKNALTPVVNGMMVYDSTLDQFHGYKAGAWGVFGGGNVVGPAPSTTNAVAVFGNNLGTTLLNTLVTLNPVTAIISGIANAVSGAGTAAAPTYTFTGDTDTGIFALGANRIGFSANGGTNFSVAGVSPTSVNYFEATGSPVGLGNASLETTGTDTNINANYGTRGTGSHFFLTGDSLLEQFAISHTANAVNRLIVTGSATGNATSITASGTDPDIGISLVSKGVGPILFPNGGAANPSIAFTGNPLTGFSYDAANTRIGITYSGTLIGAITNSAVLRLGTTGAANNATNTIVLGFGTAPNAPIANTVQLYDAQATGAFNTLGIFCDAGVVTVVPPTAPDRTIAVVVNGTTYYLHAKTTNN